LQGQSSLASRGMHGRIYAFSRATGKLLWPTPAFVAEHWLPSEQPSESPLLFFVSLRQASNKNSTVVLALDRRTGESVYENELSNTVATQVDILADPVKHTVTLSLSGQNAKNLTFQFTEQPRPPQPPAQTGAMASNTAGKPPGVNDPSLGAAIQLLRRGLGPAGVIMPLPAPR
jgi:hypothetical protein